MSDTDDEWQCPKPDCHEGIDEHPMAKFLEHLYHDVPEFTSQDAQEVTGRVIARLERAFGDPA